MSIYLHLLYYLIFPLYICFIVVALCEAFRCIGPGSYSREFLVVGIGFDVGFGCFISSCLDYILHIHNPTVCIWVVLLAFKWVGYFGGLNKKLGTLLS